jgi:Electron transfer DM13
MGLLGEFGRTFFGALYDLRVPVAIGSIVIGLAVAILAWRRGWLAAARRHRVRAGVIVVAAIAVGAPLTWYLASPIWIRTELVEAAPTAPVTPLPSGPALAPSAAAPTTPPSTAAAPAASPFARTVVARGTFRGTDDFHFGRGTATIVEVAPGRYHLRLERFSVRNGPDLYVYLSTDRGDYADDALELGRLKATDGSFGYDLPAGTDPAAYRSAIIWCKQFSHLFAVAPL